MARVLLTVWSFETHLGPFLAVASSLRDQGHEVCFYGSAETAERVSAQGFTCFPCKRVNEAQVLDFVYDGVLALRDQPYKLLRVWPQLLFGQVREQVADLDELLDQHPFDAIVSDLAMTGPFLITGDKRNLPIVVLSHVGYCMLPGQRGSVPGSALPVDKGRLMNARRKLTTKIVHWLTRDMPKEPDRLRQAYGLPPLHLRVVEHHARASLLLIPSAPSLDYERIDLPPTVRYFGACELPDQRTTTRNGHIVVDEGTFHVPEPVLLEQAARAFVNKAVSVTMIAGQRRDASTIKNIPESANIALVSWRKLETCLAGAALLVTNGNTESVLAAIVRGLPVIVVPSVQDQAEMGYRVEYAGAGICIPESSCTPAKLHAAAKRVLEDPFYRNRAGKLARELDSCGGPSAAAEWIGELVKTRNLKWRVS